MYGCISSVCKCYALTHPTVVVAAATEHLIDICAIMQMLKVRFDYQRYNENGEKLDADSDLDEEEVDPVDLDIYLEYAGREYLLGTRSGVNPLVKVSDLRPTELLFL